MNDPVKSPLTVILDDAEEIAEQLIPPPNKLAAAVGVLIQHVSNLAGDKLEGLTDAELGKPQPEPETPAPPAAGASETETSLRAEIARLSGELAEARKGNGAA